MSDHFLVASKVAKYGALNKAISLGNASLIIKFSIKALDSVCCINDKLNPPAMLGRIE